MNELGAPEIVGLTETSVAGRSVTGAADVAIGLAVGSCEAGPVPWDGDKVGAKVHDEVLPMG